MALYHDVLPWSVYALRAVAKTAYDNPLEYEKLMLQAAELNPSAYYDLSQYAFEHNQEDKAAQYADKAGDMDSDRVRAANASEWRVRYHLKKGETDTARQIADASAEVYSSGGLIAKAVFMEVTSNYDEAFDWYSKNAERYGQSGPLIAFCERYKTLTGDTRFDAELKKHENTLFPNGKKKVTLRDFHGAPADGVSLLEESELMRAAGLKKDDVIVALHGVRVSNQEQYTYLRDLQTSSELDLIVWDGASYRSVKSSPPNRRFGVNLGDYKSN